MNKLRSSSEALQAIEWERVEPELDSIWLKTSIIDDEQARLLELIFTRGLPDHFECADDGVFYFQSQLSVTIFMKDVYDPYWEMIGREKSDMKWYAEDIGRLLIRIEGHKQIVS